MHSIMLIVEKPSDDTNHARNEFWHHDVTELGICVQRDPDIQRLADNVLLLTVENHMHSYAKLCAKLAGHYRILFLTEEPQWVRIKQG